ncbi:MAG TPA: hypothetical protein PLZ32_18895 [Saprospiraceae bacterium]|nr:hypothetical protein [Saprospiraceae bacterium]
MQEPITAKSFWKKVLEWYVYGSFHVALMTGFYISFNYLIAERAFDWPYIIFVSLGTHVIYSFHKIIALDRIKVFRSERYLLFIKYHRHILIYCAMSILGMMVSTLRLSFDQILLIILPGIVSMLYVLPLFKNKRRLRDLPYIKIFLITIIYSFLCTFIPLYNLIGFQDGLLFFMISTFFILALTLTFDIRDVEIDQADHVKTIATYLGTYKAILLSLVLLVLACIIFSFAAYSILPNAKLPIFAYWIVGVISFFSILNCKNKEDLYYSLWMDGLLALPSILLITFR